MTYEELKEIARSTSDRVTWAMLREPMDPFAPFEVYYLSKEGKITKLDWRDIIVNEQEF